MILVLGSFVEYDKTTGLSLHRDANLTIMVIGFAFIILGVLASFLSPLTQEKRARLDYQKGVEIKRGDLTITIKQGEIQSIQNLKNTDALVLPANTTFIDDCATDKRSAMGAFFCRAFPSTNK